MLQRLGPEVPERLLFFQYPILGTMSHVTSPTSVEKENHPAQEGGVVFTGLPELLLWMFIIAPICIILLFKINVWGHLFFG